jgi:hypothetical protein
LSRAFPGRVILHPEPGPSPASIAGALHFRQEKKDDQAVPWSGWRGLPEQIPLAVIHDIELLALESREVLSRKVNECVVNAALFEMESVMADKMLIPDIQFILDQNYDDPFLRFNINNHIFCIALAYLKHLLSSLTKSKKTLRQGTCYEIPAFRDKLEKEALLDSFLLRNMASAFTKKYQNRFPYASYAFEFYDHLYNVAQQFGERHFRVV